MRRKGGRAADTVYDSEELYDLRTTPEGQEYLQVPAGMLNCVRRTLNTFNIPMQYTDLRPVKLPEPDWSVLDKPREGQEVILAKIVLADHGQIEAPTGDGKTWLIVQLCKIYPGVPIVIAAPGRGEAKTIRDRLLAYFPKGEIGQVGGGRKEIGRRVTVVIRNSLMKIDLTKCRILIYDECHTAAGDKTSQALSHANGCKMIGFTASPEMRSDGADMLVEALFGPVIHVTTYQESQRRGNIVPIRVCVRSVGHGPQVQGASTTTLNRQAIWTNMHRNKLIADDAKQLSANGEQVLIRVSTVIHGLELLRLLPDWTFVYASMDKRIRLRFEQDGVITPGEHPISGAEGERLQERFETGDLRKVITTCWSQGVDFPHLQVLIRADGLAARGQSVQIPGRLSRHSDGKDHGLLVDYFDSFHPTLKRRSQDRIRMYRSKGWDIEMPKRMGLAHYD